jgi:hypothetical protein
MESEAYRAAFEFAEIRATRTLEDEAVRRAHEGVRKAVRYKGKVVGTETEYSDMLLLALLKGGNRKKFGDRSQVALTGADGKPLMTLETARALLHASEDDMQPR